ncbi:hypothetical protein ACFE04_015658 [Oxalis oulophora]
MSFLDHLTTNHPQPAIVDFFEVRPIDDLSWSSTSAISATKAPVNQKQGNNVGLVSCLNPIVLLLEHEACVKEISRSTTTTTMNKKNPRVTKRPAENVAKCLTCPLCDNIFQNPTIIPDCLHTFCRDCITEKLSEKNQNKCPVCSYVLGGHPLDKLRPDHHMDSMVLKIFANPNHHMGEEPEAANWTPLPSLKFTEPLSSAEPSSSKEKRSRTQKKNLTPKRLNISLESSPEISKTPRKDPILPDSSNSDEGSRETSKTPGKDPILPDSSNSSEDSRETSPRKDPILPDSSNSVEGSRKTFKTPRKRIRPPESTNPVEDSCERGKSSRKILTSSKSTNLVEGLHKKSNTQRRNLTQQESTIPIEDTLEISKTPMKDLTPPIEVSRKLSEIRIEDVCQPKPTIAVKDSIEGSTNASQPGPTIPIEDPLNTLKLPEFEDSGKTLQDTRQSSGGEPQQDVFKKLTENNKEKMLEETEKNKEPLYDKTDMSSTLNSLLETGNQTMLSNYDSTTLENDPGKTVQYEQQMSIEEVQQEFPEKLMTENNKEPMNEEIDMFTAVNQPEVGSRITPSNTINLEKPVGENPLHEDVNSSRKLISRENSSEMAPVKAHENGSSKLISQENSRAKSTSIRLFSMEIGTSQAPLSASKNSSSVFNSLETSANPPLFIREGSSSMFNSLETSANPPLYSREGSSSKVNKSNSQERSGEWAHLPPDINVSIMDTSSSLETTPELAPLTHDGNLSKLDAIWAPLGTLDKSDSVENGGRWPPLGLDGSLSMLDKSTSLETGARRAPFFLDGDSSKLDKLISQGNSEKWALLDRDGSSNTVDKSNTIQTGARWALPGRSGSSMVDELDFVTSNYRTMFNGNGNSSQLNNSSSVYTRADPSPFSLDGDSSKLNQHVFSPASAYRELDGCSSYLDMLNSVETDANLPFLTRDDSSSKPGNLNYQETSVEWNFFTCDGSSRELDRPNSQEISTEPTPVARESNLDMLNSLRTAANLSPVSCYDNSSKRNNFNSAETRANSAPFRLGGNLRNLDNLISTVSSTRSAHLDRDDSISYVDLLNALETDTNQLPLACDGRSSDLDKLSSEQTIPILTSLALPKLNSHESNAILARFSRHGNSSNSNELNSQENVAEREPVDVYEEISNKMNKLSMQETVDKAVPPGTLRNDSGRSSLVILQKNTFNKPTPVFAQAHEEHFPSPCYTPPGNGNATNYASASTGIDQQTQAGQNISAQDASVNRKRGRPVWFSLVPAPNTKEGRTYPAISPPYLRIKDGNMPVSAVEKYVAKKLGLPNESEVQITVRGHPVNPSVSVQQVQDLWVHSTPVSERRQPCVGDSAQGFMMILSYVRKAQKTVPRENDMA